MTVFAVTPSFAQGALWGDVVAPLPQKELFNGLVGIGPFTAAPPFIPKRMLHVHSTNIVAAEGLYPAFLRLQTQVPATPEIGVNQFGETGIEFYSGSLLNGGVDWCVGKILGITNGHGLANTGQFVTPGTAEFKGGLAFYCSPLMSGTQPNATTDQIEVMRIVEDKVGIRTKTPLGQLDVNVGNDIAKPKVSITNGWTPHLDDWYGGPQLRFYIPYSNVDSPADRSSSYSWYIHTMRQYQPTCFLGLDGTKGLTDANTAMGALHFMAGYNTASHTAGDIYRDNIGDETAIPRMSMLSNGNVGINNGVPMVRFNVHNGSVLFDSTIGDTPLRRVFHQATITPPAPAYYSAEEIGSGTRLMWIPSKAAFRAGKVFEDRWDSGNIGDLSVAMGYNCMAKGKGSFSSGTFCDSDGEYSFAFGQDCHITELAPITNEHNSHSSVAIGHSVQIESGYDCLGAGHYAHIKNSNRSFALGDNVKIEDAKNAFVLGLGRYSKDANPTPSLPLENNIPESFMVGFRCTQPALFVKGGEDEDVSLTSTPDIRNTTKVGIGISNESQNSMLYVRGNVTIGDPNNSMAPLNGLISNGAAVIGGTSMYSSQLTVEGGVTGTTLGLMVVSGQTVLGGTSASGTALLTIGSEAVTSTGTGTNWTTSDRNLKKEITNFSEGLSIIKQINPVRFKYNGTLGNDTTSEFIGVIAQDIQKVAPYTVRLDTFTTQKMIPSPSVVETDKTDTIGGVKRKRPTPIQEELVVEKNAFLCYNSSPLMYLTVNAIKELDANIATATTKIQTIDSVTELIHQENQILKNENHALNQRVKDLEEKFLLIQASCCKNTELYDDVLLEQNVPNPFAKETIITYFVPERLSGRIELVIADASGTAILQRVNVLPNIPSQFTYSATDLQTGVYLYGIALNGQIIKSKKMIIIK